MEDKTLCEGCVCKVMSVKKKVNLREVCVGAPVMLDSNDEIIGTCPCTTCLVKTMCSDQICDDYGDYRKLVENPTTQQLTNT
jgi:hypothetical protein